MPHRSSARLRLRRPSPRDELPQSALPSRGALLLAFQSLLLVGALVLAYLLYVEGSPGSPRLPDWEDVTSAEKSTNRSDDAITLLVPPGVSARQKVVLGAVDHRLSNDVDLSSSKDSLLELDPGVIQLSVKLQGHGAEPFDVILQLVSGARVPREGGLRVVDPWTPGLVTSDGPYSSWQTTHGEPGDEPPPFDTDYFVLRVNPGQVPPGTKVGFDLLLRPFWPFAVRDNARVVLRSPLFNGAVECRDIAAVARNVKARIHSSLQDPFFCQSLEPAPKGMSEMVVVLDVERATWKTDLLYPQPAEGNLLDVPVGATWWNASPPIRVTGNYVNINAEAVGQRLLFLSGLLAGFAVGLVPAAVAKVRRRREAVA